MKGEERSGDGATARYTPLCICFDSGQVVRAGSFKSESWVVEIGVCTCSCNK